MRRGFTLIDVLIGLGLVIVIGSALLLATQRLAEAGRTQEAGLAAATVLKAAVQNARDKIPPWFPAPGSTVTLTREQVQELLGEAPELLYTDPDLYTVRATRSDDGKQLLIEVCLNPAGEPYCLEGNLSVPSTQARYVPPDPTVPPAPPAPGSAQLTVNVAAPAGAPVRVLVRGPTSAEITAPGLSTLAVAPGNYQLTAENTSGPLYTYEPNPTLVPVEAVAGRSYAVNFRYRCATGAAKITVVLPEGVSDPPARLVVLDPVGLDVSAGGTFPYLDPGTYRLVAQELHSDRYSYTPSLYPESFDVVACATATATAAYEPVTGALEVVVQTPSNAVTPNAVVNGPGYSTTITRAGTTVLSDLTPGAYAVSAQPVRVDGITYNPTVDPEEVSVEAGQTARSQVVYVATTAKLTVTATAPAGLTPDLEVAGPGISRREQAPELVLENLAPGTYTVRAYPLQDGRFTYGATPDRKEVELAAGDRKTVSFAYAPTSGALHLAVRGLPEDAPPPTLRVGSTSVQALDTTIPYLTPGDYTVEAPLVRHGNYAYAPDPSLTTVAVAPGEIAEVTIRYVRLEGSVTVEVHGLPEGIPAQATLKDDLGNAYPITETQMLSGLPTGTYRLEAQPVTAGGIVYQPSVSPASAVLPAGGAITFTLDYAPEGGNLEVRISPEGLAADVLVEGPEGYARAVTQTTILNNVPPGAYTLTPRPVSGVADNALTYTFEGEPTSAVVEAGRTTTAEVRYRQLAGTLRVRVEEVPQGGLELRVVGPGGFARTERLQEGANAFNYEGVPTGTYRLEAEAWDSGTITYRAQPSPTTVTLADGEQKELTITYTAATGAIVAEVSFPSGMPESTLALWQGDQRVAVASVSGSSPLRIAFGHLAPGTYRLIPEDVRDAEGFLYTASPLDVTVDAGQTQNARVTYVKQSGNVTVEFSGVPAGATPALTLEGPVTLTIRVAGTYELPSGSYRASAEDLTADGFRYTATVDPEAFALNPGQQVALVVAYEQQAGYVTLTIAGLPEGARAPFGLEGPSTLRDALPPGTYTLGPLQTGDYTLTFERTTYGRYTYAPDPESFRFALAAGDRKEIKTTYRAVTGALAIQITAPAGAPTPVVHVSGPGGFQRTLTGTGDHLLSDLPPGTYTISAETVEDNTHYPYVPSPTQAQRTVVAGQTAALTIAYSKQSATLTLAVSGLPQNAWASGQISGPLNLTWKSPNGTRSYTVPPGAYTVRANDYISGIYRYRASVSPASLTLAAGQDRQVSVAYQLLKGSLRITILGLPNGCQASVTITGPNGFRRTVTRSTTLSNLYPGTYTAKPAARTCNGYTYYAATKTVTVRSASTTDLQITYSPTRLKAVITTLYPSGSYWTTSNAPSITLTGPSTITLRPGTSYHPLVPSATYSASPDAGYQKEIYRQCGLFGCTYRAYWVLTKRSKPPVNVAPGATYTFTATWQAKRCYQQFLFWVCEVWDGSRWRRQ